MKPVRLSAHAQEQARHRGATPGEIALTIEQSAWNEAQMERKQAERVFDFSGTWNDRSYRYKKVRPVFVEESDEIVVVTVYTYYFNGGEEE